MPRVISFDCGNKNTGCVMADIDKKRNHFEIILIKYIKVDNKSRMTHVLFEYINDIIIPMIQNYKNDKIYIVYENVHTRQLYPNWDLIRLQKEMRKHFKKLVPNVFIKALRPSQKAIIGGTKRKDRKELAVQVAREFICDHGSMHMLDVFDGLKRKHDVADALLAVAYLYHV